MTPVADQEEMKNCLSQPYSTSNYNIGRPGFEREENEKKKDLVHSHLARVKNKHFFIACSSFFLSRFFPLYLLVFAFAIS